jgi:hypothetical protein
VSRAGFYCLPMRHATVARLTSSIYGTVLAIALIAAYSAEEELDSLLIATALLVTLAVFWLAHSQAELLAVRYAVGHALSRKEVREHLRHGWPMVEAGFPPAGALLLGAVGLVGEDTAVDLALGVGVAELAAWGVAVGVKEQLGTLRTFAVTALNVSLGLAVVALKLVIH